MVFHPLGREPIHPIARIQIGCLRKRLQDRDMDLDLTEAALDKLAEAGYGPVYGVCPLKRAIQHGIERKAGYTYVAVEKLQPFDLEEITICQPNYVAVTSAPHHTRVE